MLLNRIYAYVSANRLQVVYLLLTTCLLFATFSHWAYDDPFITYRYAHNLDRGLGFVYNPGEQVLSTTTPLFTLLLALLGMICSDLPQVATLIGTLSLAFGALFLWDLASTWGTPWIGWAGLLLYPTFPLLVSTLSSETPLYLALCLGTFSFYGRRDYRKSAVGAGLAVLARPDGGLVALVLAADYVIRIRASITRSVAFWFLAPLLMWVVFAWTYFGSPLPATLFAKQHQGSMFISERFLPGLLTIARDYVNWNYAGEAILSVLGLFFLIQYARAWTVFLGWVVLYFVSYTLLGVSRYYWYYAPLVPLLVVLAGFGISSLVQSRFITIDPSFRRKAVVTLLLLFALAQIIDLRQLAQHPDERLGAYRSIGEWLNSHTPAQATVGALEVGIIGYYAQRPMIDFAGLIQPDVASQLLPNTTYEDVALWATAHYRPNYIVLHDAYFPRLEKGYIAQNCRPVEHFPAKAYNYSSDMSIYSCH